MTPESTLVNIQKAIEKRFFLEMTRLMDFPSGYS